MKGFNVFFFIAVKGFNVLLIAVKGFNVFFIAVKGFDVFFYYSERRV